ncbi:MAG: himD [Gammaproteobacteria bacterium]|nr:himD [Gammaproteobacteria bacterium]
MVKSELIHRVAQRQQGLSMEDVEFGINKIFDHLIDALAKNQRIEIRGFGSFTLHYRPARTAHNPKTGEKVKAPSRYFPHFRPGKELKERVDKTDPEED